jgi:TatD DNase family protein
MLIDTHAHIHFDEYTERLSEVLDNARAAGIEALICVGTSDDDSHQAVRLASKQDLVLPSYSRPGLEAVKLYATVGLHPHEAKKGTAALGHIAELARHQTDKSKLVAIGECGLDFFKEYSPRADQEKAFRFQIDLALEFGLPMVWHVRDAFDRFFEIVDEYQGLRGIVHCFTGSRANMEQAVSRRFMVALNGIMTFTKDQSQLEAAKHIPLSNLVLETDCPFLTPAPKRGQTNEPANLALTAHFLADLRGETFEDLAAATTHNAKRLFKI